MSVSLIDQSTQNWSFRNRVVIFHFFWRLLFISNACVLEGVLNTGSDVSICCVSLPRASFSRKMSLQLIFSLCASRLDDKDTASEGSRKRDKRPEMWETNFIACVYVASGFYQFFFSVSSSFSLYVHLGLMTKTQPLKDQEKETNDQKCEEQILYSAYM